MAGYYAHVEKQVPMARDHTAVSDKITAWTVVFVFLFNWRYLRQLVHLFSFWAYKPSQPSRHPTYTARDVTIIIPTIDPLNSAFRACIISLCKNMPCRILVVTAANKRKQLIVGLKKVRTPIVALVDDHVIWKDTFLEYALPAFEDSTVGLVGTNKRGVHWEHKMSMWDRFVNMIQCLYLERHNFEIRSTNSFDGSVFVISGRTSLMRADLVVRQDFYDVFENEHWHFLHMKIGPLGPDDDNCLTRWCIDQGWNIRVQYRPETLITTTMGSEKKFSGGLIRWVRTTWRSNYTSLGKKHVWRKYPWAVYAIYLSSFTNFALFYDPILIYSFYECLAVQDIGGDQKLCYIALLVGWMIFFKMVKPFAYFVRHPQDIILIPGYFLFTWYHSLVKLNGLLTATNGRWEGRDLESLNKAMHKDSNTPANVARANTPRQAPE